MHDETCRIWVGGYTLVTDDSCARDAIGAVLGERHPKQVGLANWRIDLSADERADIQRLGILRCGTDPIVEIRRSWRSEPARTTA